jgi:calpain-7
LSKLYHPQITHSRLNSSQRLVENDIALTSGPYTYGVASTGQEILRMCVTNSYLLLADFMLLAGDYTLIISTHNPKHTGPFALNVQCANRFELVSIPQEGAGMYSKVVRGEW